MRAGVKTVEKSAGQHDRAGPPRSPPRPVNVPALTLLPSDGREEEAKGTKQRPRILSHLGPPWGMGPQVLCSTRYVPSRLVHLWAFSFSFSYQAGTKTSKRSLGNVPTPHFGILWHSSPSRSPCSFCTYLPFSVLARFLAE